MQAPVVVSSSWLCFLVAARFSYRTFRYFLSWDFSRTVLKSRPPSGFVFVRDDGDSSLLAYASWSLSTFHA
jgi:hypothetical protein